MRLITHTSLSALIPGNRKSCLCNLLSVFNFKTEILIQLVHQSHILFLNCFIQEVNPKYKQNSRVINISKSSLIMFAYLNSSYKMLIGTGIIINCRRRLNVTKLISGTLQKHTSHCLVNKSGKKQLYEPVDFLK